MVNDNLRAQFIEAWEEIASDSQAVFDSVFQRGQDNIVNGLDEADLVAERSAEQTLASIESYLNDPLNVADITAGLIEKQLEEGLGPVEEEDDGILGRIFGSVIPSFIGGDKNLDDVLKLVEDANITHVSDVAAGLQGVEDNLKDNVNEFMDPAEEFYKEYARRVYDDVNERLAAAKALSDDLSERFKEFLEVNAPMLQFFAKEVFDQAGPPLGDIATGIGDIVKNALPSFITEHSGDYANRLNMLIEEFESAPDTPEFISQVTHEGSFLPGPVSGLALGFALPMIISGMLAPALSVPAEWLAQQVRRVMKTTLLPPEQVAQMRWADTISQDRAEHHINRSGLSEEDYSSISKTQQPVPDIFTLLDFHRRGYLGDERYKHFVSLLGLDDVLANAYEQAKYPVPGVQDLISMAVREVFTPEIIERFGQMEDLPPAFIEYGKQVGLSEEWAKNYWAMHWALPSPNQGFEMLHRGVIEEEDLDLLLRSLDVMPFWRQQLKQIAYNPLTRVDVRRMHKLGKITTPELNKRYTDLGFNEENAQLMADFTVAYNAPIEKADAVRERDLTKGDLLGLYREDVIDPKDATNRLMQMGYSQDEADLLVSREKLKKDMKKRRNRITDIVDEGKLGIIGFDKAQDRLNQLNATESEAASALDDIERATTVRVKMPSKADLDSWRRSGILSSTEYSTELKMLNYPDKYVAFYLAEMDEEIDESVQRIEELAERALKERDPSRAQLDRFYLLDIINVDEYAEGLSQLKYGNRTAARFIEAIEKKKLEQVEKEALRVEQGLDPEEEERMPSRSDLDKFRLAGLINEDAQRSGLELLGYSEATVALFADLITKKLEGMNDS